VRPARVGQLLAAAATAMLVAAVLAGCGRRDAPGALAVSAAASLRDPLTRYGYAFDGGPVRFSFAGSDQLAQQVRQGAKPDVFASANTSLPGRLYAEGLVERPTVFAGNRLVLAVPARSEVRSLADAARPGVKVAIGSASVPVGSYTREVLARLPQPGAERVMANVRSEEPDVKGIVGKLTQGAVDAGFVYVTDVTATKGTLRALELRRALQPSVSYAAAVVRGTKHLARARKFVAGLVAGEGQRELRAAGFEPPPR
jgi:molybdate transport system substrate-binding protein